MRERERGEKESKGQKRRDEGRKEGERKTEKVRRGESREGRNKEKEGIFPSVQLYRELGKTHDHFPR